MMKLLAIALLIAAQAPPGRGQAPADPPSEALIDKFVSVLPDRVRNRSTVPYELRRLTALNPGREADVRAIFEADPACAAAIESGLLHILREVARGLGEARLRRMIAFYASPDLDEFEALVRRVEGNPSPSEADKAAWEKLFATYPLADFYERSKHIGDIIAADQAAMTPVMACLVAREAALYGAHLRTR